MYVKKKAFSRLSSTASRDVHLVKGFELMNARFGGAVYSPCRNANNVLKRLTTW